MKGLNIPEGTTVYIPAVRKHNVIDGENIVCFTNDMWDILSDDDTFYTLEELKQLTNDGMPKQEITIDGYLWDRWSKVNFKWTLKTLPEKGYLLNWSEVVHSEVSVFVKNQYGWISKAMSYTYPPKKTELTLAEVEEKLGIEKGSLTIKV